MVSLTRPEGPRPGDLDVSRRLFGGVFFAGYAVAALGARAEPIRTDEEGLLTEVVQLAAADRAIPAYLARPNRRGRHPVVVVVSEIFGVHEYIRDVCRRLAKAGYVAIAPDFFVRHGDPASEKDFPVILRIVEQAGEQQVMGDIGAAMAFLKGQKYADARKAAVTGFCWGGAVTWLACALTDHFDCGVAWYGRLTPPPAGEFMGQPGRTWPVDIADDLRAPVLGLYGGQDKGIPLSDVEKMSAALAASGRKNSDIMVYARSEHGFHADYRPSYDPGAAEDAWRRMLAFFARNGVKPRG